MIVVGNEVQVWFHFVAIEIDRRALLLIGAGRRVWAGMRRHSCCSDSGLCWASFFCRMGGSRGRSAIFVDVSSFQYVEYVYLRNLDD